MSKTEYFFLGFEFFGNMISLLLTRRLFSSGIGRNIGFIGIGNMGSRMAMNILKKNDSGKLYIYDKFTGSDGFKTLISGGGVPCDVPDMVDVCDVLISMVPASSHVEELYRGSLLPALKNREKPAYLIECSTIDPEVSRSLNAEVRSLGHFMIDAPVSGGIKGAEAGTLTFMVGSSLRVSDFEAQDQFQSTLRSMGVPIYCGAPGQGLSVKLCNNLILGSQMLGVAEGYRLAKTLGVDLHTFNQIVNKSTGQCWTSQKYNPVPGLMENVPAARGYTNGFQTDLMLKDLSLAKSAANAHNCPVPLTEFAANEYAKISKAGKGNFDFGVCYQTTSS